MCIKERLTRTALNFVILSVSEIKYVTVNRLKGNLGQVLSLRRTCPEAGGGTYKATMALHPAHIVEKGKTGGHRDSLEGNCPLRSSHGQRQ